MNTRILESSRWLAGAVALVAMTLLVACSGNGSDGVRGDQLAPPAEQVLRLRLTGEPKTIDPHLSNTVSETTLSKPLFGGLFTYDEGLKVVPNLATEIPTDDNGGVSKDGTTYTIKIAKDAKWSDGRPLIANDFVYSMKRALDPKLAGPYTSFFFGIVGAKDYNTARNTSKDASDADLAALRAKVGVSAKDDRTLVYQLTQPNPSFLNLLALWTAFPVRQDVVEKYGDKWTEAGNHISNGPFVLKEWAHNERIVFEPNPYWHREKPALTRLVINFIADDAAAYAAYLNDEIDSVVVPPASRREVLSPGSPLNSQLVRVSELTTFALYMNIGMPPFDNMKVRQAFGMAIDRDAYVEGVLQAGGRPTTSWIPPGMPGYDPNLGSQYVFNPAKARQLLAEAGYPDGKGLPKVTFLQVANDTNRLTGQFIQDQLKRNLGIEVDFEFVESRTYTARMAAVQHHATIQRWSADWPYPDNWLPEQFGSNGSANYSNYKNPKFDELMRRAAAASAVEAAGIAPAPRRLALADQLP